MALLSFTCNTHHLGLCLPLFFFFLFLLVEVGEGELGIESRLLPLIAEEST